MKALRRIANTPASDGRKERLVRWHRAVLGTVLIAFGIFLFLWLPLDAGSRIATTLAHLGISAGALIAFFGLGVVIAAFRKVEAD
jgi:hypothetical protein